MEQNEQNETAKKPKQILPNGIICLLIIIALFGSIGWVMGVAPMLNTIMHTAHDLLLNTCFYLMAICVLTGALGKLLVEFGVVDLIEKNSTPINAPVISPSRCSIARSHINIPFRQPCNYNISTRQTL